LLKSFTNFIFFKDKTLWTNIKKEFDIESKNYKEIIQNKMLQDFSERELYLYLHQIVFRAANVDLFDPDTIEKLFIKLKT